MKLAGGLSRSDAAGSRTPSSDLAGTSHAMLISIPGIRCVLAPGVAGELGSRRELSRTSPPCAYAGTVPRVFQSGGPDVLAQGGS